MERTARSTARLSRRLLAGAALIAGAGLTATADAAPEAKILRIDPRAAQTDGAPILTTVLDLTQAKRVDEVINVCNAMQGEARFDCIANEMEKPGSTYSSFEFQEKNAFFTVAIPPEFPDYPATFKDKARWGDKLGQPGIGTAWVILVDAAGSMGPRFDEAKAVASAFVSSMGPQDIVVVKFFNDRGVISDSGWTNSKQAAQAAIDAASKGGAGGRVRPLGSIVQQGITDSFGQLGNVGVNVSIPLHQAVVLLSNGTAGADATSTPANAMLLKKYMNGGRFPEDNTVVPKMPLPMISIWFPNKEFEEFFENAEGFMRNMANPEIGGFFSIVRDKQGGRASAIVNAVRSRFNKMHIVRWKLSCVAPSITQSFKLVFNNTVPQMMGDSSFQNVPIGFDPSTWPLDIDFAATKAEADKEPLYPGGKVRIFGNFCWSGNTQRAELYMIPRNQAAQAQTGSLEDARKAQKQLIEAGMKGRVISASDQEVVFELPDKDTFLVGQGESMSARLVVYDNFAKRISPTSAEKIISLKAKKKPLPYLLIGAATFGGVVVLLLIVSIFRGGGRRRGGTAPPPPAPRPVPVGGPSPAAFSAMPAAPVPPVAAAGPIPLNAVRATLSGAAGIFTVVPGVEMKAGRDGATCQILLSEPRVSGVHATVKFENGTLYARDDGSNNGTFVAGQRLPPHVFTPVPHGAMLRFGPVEFAVRLE